MRNKMLRRRKAVSPVIATILMVAITVVLAATLYMMLPDDTGGGSKQQSGRFSSGDIQLSEKEYKVEFAKFSPERKISDLQFNLDPPDNESELSNNFDGDLTGATATFDNLDYQLNYTDNADNKVVDSGDYLVVYNPNGLASGQYELSVLYEGNEVDSISWTI